MTGWRARAVADSINLVTEREQDHARAINGERIAEALAAAYRKGAEDMRDRAGHVVESWQESQRNNPGLSTFYLSPRRPGNLTGLSYAEKIRALPLPGEE